MCSIFSGQDPARYEPISRSLRLNGQCTSIRLERAFWEILDEMAAAENRSTPSLISEIHSELLETRGEVVNFTSLLRCACLSARSQPPAAALAAE